MAKIVIKPPEGDPIEHELSGDSLTLGRNDDNTLVVDEASISGSHAEFIASGAGYLLRDLDSTNGTLVNGEPASDTQLKNGDAVMFGHIPAHYESDEPAAEEEEEQSMSLSDAEEIAAELANSSARPTDFTSISPFPKKRKKKDPVAGIALALGVISILLSIGVAVFATMIKA